MGGCIIEVMFIYEEKGPEMEIRLEWPHRWTFREESILEDVRGIRGDHPG